MKPTLEEAISQATEHGACKKVLDIIRDLGNWDAVIRHPNFSSWVMWCNESGILPGELIAPCEAYRLAIKPAHEAYKLATEPAHEAYRLAIKPAEEAYELAIKLAREALRNKVRVYVLV